MLNAYSSNSYQDFTLAFDEDVLNAQNDEASFIAGIRYWGGRFYRLGLGTTFLQMQL